MGNILDCSTSDAIEQDKEESVVSNIEESSGVLVLERKKPLPLSLLWDRQRKYFDSLPGKPVTNKSTHLSLSRNCYVAKAYANVIIAYLKDWYSDPSNDTSEPMYIIDIGSGFGRLSNLILYFLLEMKDFWPETDHVPFVYVISDCSEQYVSLWQRDPLLSQLVQMECLDFAVFDIEMDAELVLIIRHLSITPDSLHIPPFFICSAVFSCVPQEVVKKDNDVSRGLLSMYQSSTSSEYQYPHSQQITLSFSWDYEPITNPESLPWWSLFGDSIQKTGLGVFTVPSVAGNFILNALTWCENRALFLVCDWSVAERTARFTDPVISMNEYITMSVDFSFLTDLAERLQGCSRMSDLHDSFRTCLLAFGFEKTSLSRTFLWFHHSLESFTPMGFFDLVSSLRSEASLTPQSIFYLLRLSRGDSDVFWQYRQDLLKNASTVVDQLNMHVDLDLIRDHITHLRSNNDVCFELGRLYMGVGDYETAFEMFDESSDVVGVHHVTWFNMGICSYFLGNFEEAKRCFEQSLQLKPSFEEAEKWLDLLSKEDMEGLQTLALSMYYSVRG